MTIKRWEELLMSSIWGNKLKLSIFGESHGEAIGIVINNLPAGIELNQAYIDKQMLRRTPGKSKLSTARKESDLYHIVSGFFNGKTTGSPLCAIIYNEDKRSNDYELLKDNMRPGHSDYPAFKKYSGFNDYRGGGHFSGRITAPLLFAGAVAMQILEKYKNIYVGSRIKSIYNVEDNSNLGEDITADILLNLRSMEFPVISKEKGTLMKSEILKAKEENDSVGGIIETYLINLPTGLGEPFFDSVESQLSHMIFSIPSVKGIEFGEGFDIAKMRGSSSNDPYQIKEEKITTVSNNNGGILGGITNGMPIIFRTAIKPTPSIFLTQNTVNVATMENTEIKMDGRHDPCIVTRALPVIEGAASLVILDLILEREGEVWRTN